MKHFLPFCLPLLLLTACRIAPEETPFPDRPAESIVAEAVITEGRTPEENYDLPTSFTTDLALWDVQEDGPALLTELSEANAAFYGLDYEKALIRWGSSLAEFDWNYGTPRGVLPQIWQFDIDGDWQDELIIDCYVGSGTGISIEGLHILEKNADNTLTAYTFPEAAWRERLWEHAVLSCGANRGYISFGRDMVEFDIFGVPEDALKKSVETGEIACFEVSEKNIVLKGAFCLDRESRGGLQYIADYSASISYQDGAFLLTDFHLDGYLPQ